MSTRKGCYRYINLLTQYMLICWVIRHLGKVKKVSVPLSNDVLDDNFELGRFEVNVNKSVNNPKWEKLKLLELLQQINYECYCWKYSSKYCSLSTSLNLFDQLRGVFIRFILGRERPKFGLKLRLNNFRH